MPATVNDAVRAVDDGSYRTLSNAELVEILKAFGNWVMTNDAEKHRMDYQAPGRPDGQPLGLAPGELGIA
jgi:hypothetical protein